MGSDSGASFRRLSKKDDVESWFRGADYFNWDIVIGKKYQKVGS
jgi:hypothetical protein